MVPFGVSNIVRHPYKKDPKRDPNIENYPSGFVRWDLACAGKHTTYTYTSSPTWGLGGGGGRHAEGVQVPVLLGVLRVWVQVLGLRYTSSHAEV